ncbi:CheR family methyltransferase [Vulgatibacter sp.]|uniref:CheR family methyltransferase n=1 Tax=Vulgatibacter sp. TaxID=1971226 RepID=UPI00356A7495
MDLPLSPQVFAIFSALIEERSGLHYGLQERELLSDKLTTRAIEAGFTSLLDYYYFLRYDADSGPEFEQLVDALVVGETYFFREWDQVVALVDRELASLARDRKVRIWSAACSTGEEPLSLAMLLEDRGLLDRAEIVASDISGRALARAKRGVYSRRALRQVPERHLVERWLEVHPDEIRIDRSLIDRIDWRRINLLDDAAVGSIGTVDAILCRNVLIYFRDDVITQVVDRLASALRPGGVLAVGVSESLLRFGTRLACEERGGFFFYRRT